jgi:hypothetical protein
MSITHISMNAHLQELPSVPIQPKGTQPGEPATGWEVTPGVDPGGIDRPVGHPKGPVDVNPLKPMPEPLPQLGANPGGLDVKA